MRWSLLAVPWLLTASFMPTYGSLALADDDELPLILRLWQDAHDSDPETRLAAAGELGRDETLNRTADDARRTLLVLLAGDGDPRVAALAKGGLEDSERVRPIGLPGGVVEGPAREVQGDAFDVESLERPGARLWLQLSSVRAQDPDPGVRRRALLDLARHPNVGDLDSSTSRNAILGCLKDEDDEVVRRAIAVASRLPRASLESAEMREAIRPLLEGGDFFRRTQVLSDLVIGTALEEEYRDRLLLAVRDPKQEDAVVMVQSGLIGLPLGDVLLLAVHTERSLADPESRILSQRELAEILPRVERVPPLLLDRLYEIRDPDVQIAVLHAIGRSRATGETTGMFLVEAITSDALKVRDEAYRVVAQYGREKEVFRSTFFQEQVSRKLTGSNAGQRDWLLDLLHVWGDSSALAKDVEKLTRNDDEAVRVRAWSVLPRLTHEFEPAVVGLTGLLESRNPVVRAESARALSRFRQHALPALPAVVALLNDEDDATSAAAVEAIQRIRVYLPPDE